MLFKRSKICSLFSIIVCVFCAVSCAFLNANSAFASDSFTVYWRSFSQNGSNAVNQSGAFSGSYTGLNILGADGQSYKILYGFSMDFAVTDNSTYQYKNLKVQFTAGQNVGYSGDNSWAVPLPKSLTTIGTNRGAYSSSNSCVGTRNYTDMLGQMRNNSVTYVCNVSWENATAQNAQLVLGTIQSATNSSPALAIYCGNTMSPACYTAVSISDLSYELTGSNDPSYSQLEVISSQITMINNNIENHNAQEEQGWNNISNQSTNDIPNSTDQSTTNLIGVISSFVTAIGGINATDCQLTLPFPNYAGGSTTVDVCQGKDKAPQIVQIGSSMFLLLFFLPLAWLLLKLIYNEIRSWTNG